MKKRAFIQSVLLGAAGLTSLSLRHKSISSITDIQEAMSIPTPQGEKRYFKEAYHYVVTNTGVQCQLCPNYCIIKPGKRGACRNRINQDGKLMTMAYGNPAAVHNDPVEKKPLFHFHPGSRAFSIATAGCVLSCLNCQNWELSQSSPDLTQNQELMPTQVLESCEAEGCTSIAYTYSEPISWYEYALDTAKVARHRKIYNLLISCGYINEVPLRQMAPFMDAANITLKSFSDEIYGKLNGGSLEPVLKTLHILKETGVWLEITNLVVPTWTDDLSMIRRMAQYLVKEGFEDAPLHFLRFFPQYKLTQLSATPIDTLLKAREIAMAEGMKYVYLGNVPGTPFEDTYCPRCKKIVINRSGFRQVEKNLVSGNCGFCGEKIAGRW